MLLIHEPPLKQKDLPQGSGAPQTGEEISERLSDSVGDGVRTRLLVIEDEEDGEMVEKEGVLIFETDGLLLMEEMEASMYELLLVSIFDDISVTSDKAGDRTELGMISIDSDVADIPALKLSLECINEFENCGRPPCELLFCNSTTFDGELVMSLLKDFGGRFITVDVDSKVINEDSDLIEWSNKDVEDLCDEVVDNNDDCICTEAITPCEDS